MPLFPMDSGVKNSYNEMRLKSLLKSTYFFFVPGDAPVFFLPATEPATEPEIFLGDSRGVL